MKSVDWKKILIYGFSGLVLNIVGRGLMFRFPDIPLYLNYTGTILSAYYAGPLVGSVVGVLTCVFSILYKYFTVGYGIAFEIGFISPMLAVAILVGVSAKTNKFFEKFLSMVGMYVTIAFIRSFCMIVMNIAVNDGKVGIPISDSVVDFLDAHDISPALQYPLPVLLICFMDTFASMFVIFLIRFIVVHITKRHNRKKFLSRNSLGTIAVVLMAGMFILVPSRANAAADSNFVQKLYNAQNGLLGGMANYIVQTSDGAMWIATYGGLYEFNGTTFTMMRDMPQARSVSQLYADSNDNLWISSNGTGLVVRTADDRIFSVSEEEGLPSAAVRAVVQFDDSLYYVGTGQGTAVVAFDGNSLTIEDTIDDFSDIIRMCLYGDQVVGINDKGKVTILTNGEVTDRPEFDENINDIYLDTDGTLYLAGNDGTLYEATISGGKLKLTGSQSIDGVYSITSVFRSSDGTMYLACEDFIGYFNDNGGFSIINTDNFNNSICFIMEDYQGNIWFASDRCGILELCVSAFTNLFDVCNVSEVVTNAACEWKGLLYVGTDTGLVVLDEKREAKVTNDLSQKFDGVRIRYLEVDDNGHLWIGTQTEGCYEIANYNEIYNYTPDSGLPSNKARSILCLSDGRTVVSTDSGIAYIKDHEVQKTLLNDDEMQSAYALCLENGPDGMVLAGTNGDGLCMIKADGTVEYLTSEDGLPSGVVLKVVKDRFSSGYFVLTGSGMCYMYSDFTIKEFEEFPYYNNTDLFQTDDGKVVVLSTAGLYITDYYELMSFETAKCTHMDENMGLPGSVTSNSKNFLNSENVLYFVGNTGVYRLDCDNYEIDIPSYKLKLDYYTTDGDEGSDVTDDTIFLPNGTKILTLNFFIYNYTTTNPYIRYYMAGVDETKTTVQASDLSEIVYFNLESGSHTFYIEVLDVNKSKVLDTKTYTIVKEQENYEKESFKIYFYGGLGFVLISIGVWILIIILDNNTKRQKEKYNTVLQKLEREKTEALEKSLKQEESANRSKSDFLANMSHEIRTPINAIIGMDTMIIRESDQEKIKGYAENVYSASNTLLSLINDILDFSKIESGKMELVQDNYDLGKVLNDLSNMIAPKAKSKGLSFTIEANPEIPSTLFGDEVRIKQVALNVLNNAVKYTEKGSVTMKVDYTPAGNNQIALSVSVEDTGIGIKEEDIAKLFSPFERIEENRNRNIEGTGLGMSITKSLLALMGSRLEVKSVYGQGSVFSFTILQTQRSVEKLGDYTKVSTDENEIANDVEAFHAPDAKILVVDDVEMNLLVVKNLLKRIEIGIETAASGQEAIDLCRENTYDIIFMDSMMPEMSGEEALIHIKKECPANFETPVIMLTAHAIKGAREEYLEKGFENYLSKPVDGKKLEAMIQNYLPDDKIILWDGTEEKDNSVKEAEGSEKEGSVSTEEGQIESENARILRCIGEIEEIELSKGIEAAGGEDTYLVVARNFYDTANMRISMLREYYNNHDLENYTIQVHALKSTARLVGDYSLSERAWELEQAGREGNIEVIDRGTAGVIEDYEKLHDRFGTIYESDSETADEDTRSEMDHEGLIISLSEMKELLEAFDMETAKELFDSLNEYKLPKDFGGVYEKIRAELAEVNRDEILKLLDQYINAR